jgi:hypothetical protein
MHVRGWLLGGAICTALLTGAVEATPRYSMMVGQRCNLCHQNPTGGGQRDPYASEYLVGSGLAMQLGAGGDAGSGSEIGDDLVVGADLRTIWLNRDDRDTGNNFRQMQGSIYLTLRLDDPRYSIYVQEELGQRNEAFEIWGMGYVLPANGYVKVGRFVPAFGWKLPDHRVFSRRDFVFLPAFPPHSDTGIEIGLHPGNFAIEGSVLNGQFQSILDRDDDLAFTGRGSWRWTREPFHLVVGGSWYGRDGEGEDLDAGGPFAGARWGPLVWLGELDWTRREPVGDRVTKGFVTTQELTLNIVQGLNLVGTWDFFDPDLDLKTGSVTRIGAGLDALVYPFLQVAGKVNVFIVEDGDGIDDALEPSPEIRADDFVQTQLQIHFLY